MYLLMQFGPQAATARDLRVEVRCTSPGGTTHLVIRRNDGETEASIEPCGPMTWALGETLQIRLPFESLRARRGDIITFAIVVLGEGHLMSAVPVHGVMSIELPAVDYELQHQEV
jgi:hypothetical protein